MLLSTANQAKPGLAPYQVIVLRRLIQPKTHFVDGGIPVSSVRGGGAVFDICGWREFDFD